jgi:DNA-binding transcriptional MerR regulator
MESNTYSIKTAARLVDMNSHTIRAWERRYKALDPNRNTGNNRREYTVADIKRLGLLSRLVKSGHQISHIAALSNDILSSMSSTAAESRPVIQKSTESIILESCLNALRD